jgi:hypothetical protein
MVGCAAVTTLTADCIQCAAGKYNDLDNEQLDECETCTTGEYAAGAQCALMYAPF